MKNKKPILTVVMPVYNAESYLCDSIDSILTQTFTDFEFIIVDDASTDSSIEILKRYENKDKRIKLIRNEKNLMQGASVTRALNEAQGDFIARMDADDISDKYRFEKQINFLRNNRKVVAVGSQCRLINKKGKIVGEKTFPTDFESIYKYIFEFCPVQQPTMMFAVKRLPFDFKFYDHGMSPVEDVELLLKLFKYGKVENMNEYLLKYRIHGENSSLRNLRKSFLLTFISRMRGILKHGYVPTPKGLLVTFAQLVIVMTLPQNVSFTLYQFAKDFTFPSLSFFTPNNLLAMIGFKYEIS